MLKKQVSSKIVALVFSIIVICFAIAFYVVAWDEPGSAPPEGNVPAPLNTSSEAQAKIGGLLLNTGGYPNGLIVDQGNVGIGTTSPSGKLDVVGNIVASGTICDSTGCIGGGGGGAFGDWVDMGNSQVVNGPAATDGFVLAVGITTASGPMYIRTDSNPNPSTIRCKQTGYHSIDANKAASCFAPVRNGDYWKVTHNATVAVYWIPLGN